MMNEQQHTTTTNISYLDLHRRGQHELQATKKQDIDQGIQAPTGSLPPAQGYTVSAPYVPNPDICITCKMPLNATSYGWQRLYGEHSDHTGHLQRFGFCLIPCPMCSGGVEAKRTARLITGLFGDAHIPFSAKDWGFHTIPKGVDAAAIKAVKSYTTTLLAGYMGKQRGLYLVGDRGRGKTGLAISALQFILRKGHSGVYIQTKELFDLLRESIAASRRIERGEKVHLANREEYYEDAYAASRGAKLLRLVRSVEVLVLDDLGVENHSRYVIGELYSVLEARRSQGLYTIFTSNRDADNLQEYWGNENEGVFLDALRVIDRLGEYCMVVSVQGSNLRMGTKQ